MIQVQKQYFFIPPQLRLKLNCNYIFVLPNMNSIQDYQNTIHYESTTRLQDNLIDPLLEDETLNKQIFHQNRDFQGERNYERFLSFDNQGQSDEEQRLFHNTILKQDDSNCFLPEQPFQEIYQTDLFLLIPPQHSDPVVSQRKNVTKGKNNYEEQTRMDKVQRYKFKKTKRIWNHKIFYISRKWVADNRVRVNGRFVKKTSAQPIYNDSLTTGKSQFLRRNVSEDINQFYS